MEAAPPTVRASGLAAAATSSVSSEAIAPGRGPEIYRTREGKSVNKTTFKEAPGM
jgi:hypothetical protein